MVWVLKFLATQNHEGFEFKTLIFMKKCSFKKKLRAHWSFWTAKAPPLVCIKLVMYPQDRLRSVPKKISHTFKPKISKKKQIWNYINTQNTFIVKCFILCVLCYVLVRFFPSPQITKNKKKLLNVFYNWKFIFIINILCAEVSSLYVKTLTLVEILYYKFFFKFFI